MFIDAGLFIKVFVYIVGGIMPFVYNYYFVKRKAAEVRNTKEANKLVTQSTVESKLPKNTSVEPITLSNTLSLQYIHGQESDTKGALAPLYVLLVIDQNTMNNPETLNKVISNVPKIVGSFENSLARSKAEEI